MAIWKDEGLEYLDNSKYIFEIIQINSFTIESILECEPIQISKII
jgi:hypothetical protein